MHPAVGQCGCVRRVLPPAATRPPGQLSFAVCCRGARAIARTCAERRVARGVGCRGWPRCAWAGL
eukprot:2710397-Lingulodinium_polyedra.AAC.1